MAVVITGGEPNVYAGDAIAVGDEVAADANGDAVTAVLLLELRNRELRCGLSAEVCLAFHNLHLGSREMIVRFGS